MVDGPPPTGNGIKHPFEIGTLVQDAADSLVKARLRGIALHHGGDIRASGNEVEIPIRDQIAPYLSSAYHVGHGHIVDHSLNQSPQIDVIISDTLGGQSLFRAQDGTEYVPYESVYAIGEAKSSYEKKHLAVFSETVKFVKQSLNRAVVTPQTGRVGNPLFSFMLFVNSDAFDLGHFTDHYRATPTSELPNCVCLLDRGVVQWLTFPTHEADKFYSVACPEYSYMERRTRLSVDPPAGGQPTNLDGWYFVPFCQDGNYGAANLASLIVSLLTHLNYCVLDTPDLFYYLRHIFEHGEIAKLE